MFDRQCERSACKNSLPGWLNGRAKGGPLRYSQLFGSARRRFLKMALAGTARINRVIETPLFSIVSCLGRATTNDASIHRLNATCVLLIALTHQIGGMAKTFEQLYVRLIKQLRLHLRCTVLNSQPFVISAVRWRSPHGIFVADRPSNAHLKELQS